MEGLFLDDERFPQDVTWMTYPEEVEWKVVRTYGEFVCAVVTKHYDIISFDHDIQDFDDRGIERTGYTCLKWMVELALDGVMKLPMCVVHSQNPTGAENIRKYYENACKYLESLK